MLEARHHPGVIGLHRSQDHLPAARHATHHANSRTWAPQTITQAYDRRPAAGNCR
jgi:hypothetical protein